MSEMKLYNGDCLTIMNDVPDKSIDMILCDLPYGKTQNRWDNTIPFNDYVCIDDNNYNLDEFLLYSYKQGLNYKDANSYFVANKNKGLWSHYQRIIKDNGVVVLFGQGMFYTDLINSNKKIFRYDLVWDKTLISGFLNANRMPLRQHEQIAVFYKKLPKYHPQFTNGKPLHSKGKTYKDKPIKNQNYGKFHSTDDNSAGSTEKYPTSILNFPKPHPSIAVHPTQKPVELLEYLIKTYTDENDTVLDNCMGSGNTGVACLKNNRKFIGIELDKDYFEIAKSRIEEVGYVKNI